MLLSSDPQAGLSVALLQLANNARSHEKGQQALRLELGGAMAVLSRLNRTSLAASQHEARLKVERKLMCQKYLRGRALIHWYCAVPSRKRRRKRRMITPRTSSPTPR